MRLSLLVALVATFFATVSAHAQFPPTAASTGPESANAEPVERTLERLIDRLEDEQRRDRLIGELKLLLEANRNEETAGTSDLLTQVSRGVAYEMEDARGGLRLILNSVSSLDQGLPWLNRQLAEPERRAFWRDVGTASAIALVAALLAHGLGRLALSPLVRRLRARVPRPMAGRVFVWTLLLALDAIPVVFLLAAGYAATTAVEVPIDAAATALALVNVLTLRAAFVTMARCILSPATPALRPLDVSDAGAAYLFRWTKRLLSVLAVGLFVSEAAGTLGMGYALLIALNGVIACLFAALLIYLILRNRRRIAAVIRGTESGPMRRRLADVWHVLAVLYVLVALAVFMTSARGGFEFLAQATAITLVAAVVARVTERLVGRALDSLLAVRDGADRRYPGLHSRAQIYRSVAERAIELLLALVTVLVILEAWGIDLIGSIEGDTRSAVLGSLFTILLVPVVAVALWELANGLIARALQEEDAFGRPQPSSSRAKTLLPLLRRTIFIALAIAASLVVLSELGVNIAPLLAGAGVLGLAIGFGSQALVRDVITGLFILIEDTIQIGDVVTAGGHTGVVEDISVRTIRLRDLEGSVHTVPFGDVTSIVNLTRDFSFALLDVGVAYREDTDRVAELLREIGADLRADPEFKPMILEPIEILGVDSFADSAVIIRARIKTRPIKQWAVKREFNRRMKKRFDAEGIEIPFPHVTLYFGEDRGGMAPPARLRLDAESAAALYEAKPGGVSGAAEAIISPT